MAKEQFDFMFYKWEKEMANKPYLMQPFGDSWETYTWGETGDMARRLAAGLLALGLPEKSHIGLISKNCREWIIADLAIMMAGYVSVPLYPTLNEKEIEEVLSLGDVSALFVGKVDKWEENSTGRLSEIPTITFPNYKDHARVKGAFTWESMLAENEPLNEVKRPFLDDTWTIVFTSGTTGKPKGVVITYETLEATKRSTEELNPLKVSFDGDNRYFSYLPLNHIAERIVVEGTSFRYGGVIAFSESLEMFSQNLREAKPTVFFGVPRIYTKFMQGVLSNLPQSKLDELLSDPESAEKTKRTIRENLGLDNCRSWCTGAAPMPDHEKKWYEDLGMTLTDGYGLTETSAIGTTIVYAENKPGSVGKAQPGVDVRVDADSNEILMKSPYLMSGYYNEPEKTAEVIQDGWFHTGDQGFLDEDGYLFITGRLNDSFKTTKGKFIVPAPIEWQLDHLEEIDQCCVVGRGCTQPMALVVLSEVGKSKSKEDVKATLQSALDKQNDNSHSYEKLSTVVVTKEPWSQENGLLTPTFKVKRTQLNKKYECQLAGWEENKETIIYE